MTRFRNWRLAAAALALALGFAAWGAAPAAAHTLSRPVRPSQEVARPEGYAQVVDELRAWNLEEAGRILARLKAEKPGLPEWEGLEGAIFYLKGDFTRSIERLDSALRKRAGDSEWLELRFHVRQSQAAVEGFKVHRTAHFEIWHDPGDAVLMPYLGEALEISYKVLGDELGVHPKRPVRVELFTDSARFNKASTLSQAEIESKGAVGICKFNKIMMLSPGALLRGYRWLDTASHEYVHYLIVLGTKNRTPIWLHEGIAKYLERRWRGLGDGFLNPGEEMLLSKARESDGFVPFQRMEPSLIYLDTPEDVQLAYAEAATAADFIRRRGGKRGMADMLRAIGGAKGAPAPAKASGEAPPKTAEKVPDAAQAPAPPKKEDGPEAKPQEEAPSRRRASLVELESTGPPQSAEPGLQKVFGVDLAGFEKKWKDDLKRRPLRPHPGAQVQRFRLKPTGPVDESAADLEALKSAVARRRMRLGDRLSLAGRLEAALIEYRRALRDEPYSQALLNRVAQLQVQAGQPEEALRHVQRAIEVDPDYATSYIHQAMAYELTGKPAEARRAWEEVLHINPFIPLVHERLAAIYEKAGDRQKAQREREALRALRGR
ncbi:MAG: tetratricopeptide repeat protein [Candidatus Tectomicrobia bacterium]|uniref:Tetratricopeptide repeat protein n=1 Tax=Tectimicrobiota bacterium TaxID=2528274 RepID=A0A932MQF3_UNCTE|nr:tetratricopeptide repeat protein [Candidatus Tectomicrobia bacterium]